MNHVQLDEKLYQLKQEISLAGDATDALRLEMRAAIDTLRLENEVLKRFLQLLYPEIKERLAEVRAEVMHDTDPEADSK